MLARVEEKATSEGKKKVGESDNWKDGKTDNGFKMVKEKRTKWTEAITT